MASQEIIKVLEQFDPYDVLGIVHHVRELGRIEVCGGELEFPKEFFYPLDFSKQSFCEILESHNLEYHEITPRCELSHHDRERFELSAQTPKGSLIRATCHSVRITYNYAILSVSDHPTPGDVRFGDIRQGDHYTEFVTNVVPLISKQYSEYRKTFYHNGPIDSDDFYHIKNAAPIHFGNGPFGFSFQKDFWENLDDETAERLVRESVIAQIFE